MESRNEYPYQSCWQNSNPRKERHQNQNEGRGDKNGSASLPPHVQPSNPTGSFFIPRPPTNTDTSLTVHNLSSVMFTSDELQLLSKGLSFAPTPLVPQTRNYYDQYGQSLRKKYVKAIKYYVPTPQPERVETTTMSKIYCRLRFLPHDSYKSATQDFSGVQKVEHYIELTKPILTTNYQL